MASLLSACGSADPAAAVTPTAKQQHLPDISEEVRARVTQCLRGAPSISFITTDEDSALDNDASPRKRRRSHIKLGR